MKIVSQKAKRVAPVRSLTLGARIVRATLPVFLCSLPFLSQAQTPLKVGDEFQINTYTQSSQVSSQLSRLNDGNFVAVWQSAGQDGSGTGIYAQLYDMSGTPSGIEFRVNTTTYESQSSPSLATLNDGSFVVAWINSSDGGPGGETISAQRFDGNGTKLGSEIRVQSSPTEFIEGLSVTPLNNGGFVVGWGEMQFGYRTNAQVYNADGTTAGSKITGKSGSREVQVMGTLDGGFMLVALDSNRLFGQRYLANGETNGAEFFISESSAHSQSGATISRLSNNDLLVVWESLGEDGSSFGVSARRFNADATAKGAEFRVNTHTLNGQFNPASTPLDNGGYLISWQSTDQDGSQEGIYAQAYNSNDSRDGDEFLVNTTTENRQITPAISAISNNDFVVSWSGRLASGSFNIYAQRFQLEAVQANTMTITLPQTTVLEGDVVTLPLQVSGADIYGLDAIVSLSDTTKARVSGGEYGEFLPSDERLSVPMGINDNQWDGALALMAPATAKSGEGNFATVTLIAEQAGTVNLTLQAQMTDQQGNYLNQSNTDYAFTIGESVTLTGNVADLGIAGDFVYVTLYQSVSGVSISPLATGGYLVGWSEYSSADSDSYSFASVFNSSGVLQISQPMQKSGASFPAIAQTNDNGFLMVAKSTRNNRIIGQQFDANGDIKGAEFFVSTASGFPEGSPSVNQLSNGEFVVVWSSLDRDGHASGVYARHFNSNAVAKGADFLVNTHTQDDQTSATSTALDNGGYLISWQSWQQDGSQDGIYVQAFNNDGSRNGEEFLANTTTDDTQFLPAINAVSDNDFVVSWTSLVNSNDYNIYAQRFQLEAVQANTMTITLPQTTVLEGDVVTLPLQVSGADIYGLDAIVSLSDTTKARVSGGEYGEFLPSDERLSVPMGINDNQWDGALALMAPATAKSGEGNFATVTLIAEQAGTVNLTLQAQMTDQQGNYLNQSNTDYAFTIGESVTLTGNVADLGIAGDFVYVTLYINGQRVTINPDGSFSVRVGLGEVTMSLAAPGHLTAEKQITLAAGQADIDFGQINLVGGDSNGDNLIDIADLTQLLGAYRSVDGQQNGYVMAADFNRDGAINLQDLTLLGANFGKQGPQSW
ncbi:hypothetical protein PRUB_a2508 [Pseudoalteromonas rubra]|uniref:Dockerin domain-containing protein n=1 Tax=Pseudoalteromonas rubra TaxID=43658 RepID=A0A8T0CBB4_9GAMM|nr:dockerin type I domain-containing protein [Pseudoalteromonas rubra]KAF7787969.1 hypothetical protein PRUB_a2508 [Pseudoalteromonas rubra]